MQAFARARDLVGSLGFNWLVHAAARLRQRLRDLTNPVLLESLAPVGVAVIFAVAMTAGAHGGAGSAAGGGVEIGAVANAALTVPSQTSTAVAAPPPPSTRSTLAISPVVSRASVPPTSTGGHKVMDLVQPPSTGQPGCVGVVGRGYYCPDPNVQNVGRSISNDERRYVPQPVQEVESPIGDPVPPISLDPADYK